MLIGACKSDAVSKLGHAHFRTSVDTGWINDENPLEKAQKIAETNKFQTPVIITRPCLASA